MYNKNPIFILGFQRGGTGILQNILLSHPNICKTRGELHELFHGRRKTKNKIKWLSFTTAIQITKYLPIMFIEMSDIFSITKFHKRKPLKKISKKIIDRVLYFEKMKAIHTNENLYKHEYIKYTNKEISSSRLLVKNLNGLIFLTENLYDLYPDAFFIGFVRNGFAVCEGHKRRGFDIEESAMLYEKCCREMIKDEQLYTKYKIIRFEDIFNDINLFLKTLFNFIELNIEDIKKIRMVVTPIISDNGVHKTPNGLQDQELRWYSFDELNQFFNPNINENQINRLSIQEQKLIVNIAGDSLRHFDYL